MSQSNESIDELIKCLKDVKNKDITLNELIEEIYFSNIIKSFRTTEKYIKAEIVQSKNVLEAVRQNLFKEGKIN